MMSRLRRAAMHLRRRLPRIRSIRTRLIVAFGALLLLGALNTAVYFWGAHHRTIAIGELTRALRRMDLVNDVFNRLSTQKKFIDMTSGLEEPSPPPPEEERRFAGEVDQVPAALDAIIRISGPATNEWWRSVNANAQLVVDAWKKYYTVLGTDPAAGVVALVNVEEVARKLLTLDLPTGVNTQKNDVLKARLAFEETDRAVSKMSLLLFVVSALLGGFLAYTTSRDMIQAITALRAGAERLGSGDLEHRISVRSRDELRDVAQSFNGMAERLLQRSREVEEQRKVSESLLLNILPRNIAEELRQNGKVQPKYYSDATIIFTDFVAFTRLFDALSVDRMVHLLDGVFTRFDSITREFGLEKLKTIGDAYMCAGGLLRTGASHPVDAVMASFAYVDAVRAVAREEKVPLFVRVGLHTGPVAAGVVGIDKFAFDVWGDTVNFAARLQATSEPDRINISGSTYGRVKDFFLCEYRGQVETKEKRSFEMYFVDGLHPELVAHGCPPPPFTARYQIYFESPPAAFPSVLVTV